MNQRKYTRRHMSVNIAGFIRNHSKLKDWSGYFTDENGKDFNDAEARKFIQQCLHKGWKLIPCGDCEGFDHFGGGCPGHPITKEQYEQSNT